MKKLFYLFGILFLSFSWACADLPLSADAKAKYIKEQKHKADAYVMANVNCEKTFIEQEMSKTRSDLTLREKKNENFKLIVASKKYFGQKYKNDSVEIRKLAELSKELSLDLDVCRKVNPVVDGKKK